MANKDVSLSNQIYKSRDEIRDQIIEYLRTYLELENVDLTKSTFLSFIVNTLSTLTSNLIFYQSSIYKEFFLTKAQLSESIYSLSTFIGYDTKKAQYSTVDILFTLPLEFSSSDISFTIPEGFKVSSGDVMFTTDFETVVSVENNSLVTVTVNEDNRSYNVPVDISEEDNECYFLLNVKQIKSNTQEFQIEEDLQQFQFVTIDVPLESQLSDISVQIKGPNSSFSEPYTEFSSLFLMGPEDRGFVQRPNDDGITLYFGNGLIGYQPQPGSTVSVETVETNGEEGNVIPGSIKSGERIYIFDEGERQILNYSITNPVSPQGGKDTESIEEIRNNSIANLATMDRLVSDFDYNNFDLIMNNSIFGKTIPVLKRSDLKVNEIQIYTTFNQNGDLVPSRNEIIETTDKYIPRGTIVNVDGTDFTTLFDINIDPINKFGEYYYYIDAVTNTPNLESTYDIGFSERVVITNYNIERESDNAVITVNYYTDQDPCTVCNDLTCDIEFLESQEKISTINEPTEKKFTAVVPIENLPEEDITLLFNINYNDELFVTYSDSVIFKKDFTSVMASNVVIDSTNSEDLYIVYDVPTIKSDYITDTNRQQFEKTVLQQLAGLDFNTKRMITDFLNIKLANSVGLITNMLKNKTQARGVIDIVEELPNDVDIGDRYIYKVTGEVATYQGSDNWDFTQVSNNTIIYVNSLGYKLIFTGERWIKPEYNLPLEIEIEAFVEPERLGSEASLIETIKDELYSEFSSRFGPEVSLYKSEIVNIVHNIDGIKYCHVVKPESDIFFNFSTKNFTQEELLEYTPELVHFTKDSVRVRIFRG